ncbi:MAG: 6-aminohexanoate hydrolase, partial [Pseudomonas sp.]
MLRFTPLMACALLGLTSPLAGAATPTFADAQASDPARLQWMVGAPPPADRTVRFEDGSYFRFPA